jgi:hypothetical protein
MNITSNDLRKGNYGTPCGTVGELQTSLSHPLIIEFIDKFFGGVLSDIESYEENGHILIAGGQPKLKQLTISKIEFEHFTKSISEAFYNDMVSEFASDLDVTPQEFKLFNLNCFEVNQPEIICNLFTCLVDYYGGSFRCDYMYDDDGSVDLESE